MNYDEIWQAVDVLRLRVAALLESLGADDWRRPSLSRLRGALTVDDREQA